jgi:bloom syndrome protein
MSCRRAAFLSSIQEEWEQRETLRELHRYYEDPEAWSASASSSSSGDDGGGSNSLKMLYITPERFTRSEGLKRALQSIYSKGLLSRFVIDEAHCLSQWGHDFRPDYLALKSIRTEFPGVPIMALTATANQTVVNDSMQLLKMQNAYKHTMSFNRGNLRYSVREKRAGAKLIQDIAKIILDRRGQTGIIYCFSKKDTEALCEALQQEIPAMRNQITFYHADVSDEDKNKRQRAWSKGDVKVICATIAFGMVRNEYRIR